MESSYLLYGRKIKKCTYRCKRLQGHPYVLLHFAPLCMSDVEKKKTCWSSSYLCKIPRFATRVYFRTGLTFVSRIYLGREYTSAKCKLMRISVTSDGFSRKVTAIFVKYYNQRKKPAHYIHVQPQSSLHRREPWENAFIRFSASSVE